METVEFDIHYNSRSDEFRFYPLGDIHLGAIECAEDEVKKQVGRCLNDPHGYLLGKGDYAECITQKDPRWDTRNIAEWVERDNIVESQRRRVDDLFDPLAQERRIIALLTGNHEETIHTLYDNDIVRNICYDLDVKYGGYQCFVLLRFIRQGGEIHTFIWHAWHGAGCAQTEGARLMRLMRLVGDIEADIYTHGHIHGAITTHTPDRIRYNPRTHKIESVKIIATLSGSWVKGFMQSTPERPLNPHYAEKKGYKPQRIGSPIIHICPHTREMWIEA